MKITVEQIKKESGSEIYKRGKAYFEKNKVKLISIDLDKFTAQVDGKFPYNVEVQKIGENFYSSCSCVYWTTCKHIVAAMLEARDWYAKHGKSLEKQRTHPYWKAFFDNLYKKENENFSSSKRTAQYWRVIFLLALNSESWSLTPQKAYVKKNGMLGRFSNIGEFDLTSKELLYSPNDPIVVSYIQKIDQQHHSFYNSRYFSGSYFSNLQVYHYRYGSALGPLFDLLKESLVYKAPYEDQLLPIKFETRYAKIVLRFLENNKDYQLSPFVQFNNSEEPLNPNFKILSENPIWLLKDNFIIKVENICYSNFLLPFSKDKIELTIPKDEFSSFLQDFYSHIANQYELDLPASYPVTQLDKIQSVNLYLDETDRHLEIKLGFDYENFIIEYSDPRSVLYKQEGNNIYKIVRNKEKEDSTWHKLLDTDLKEDSKGRLKIIDSKALKWLFMYMPKLSNQGFVFFGRENLVKYKVRTGSPNVRIAVTSKIDWFDLNIEIDVDGIDLSLKELRKAVRQNSRYVKLADQSIAQLPEEWFKKFQHLFHFTTAKDDKIQIPQFHVTLVDILFEEAEIRATDDKYYACLEKLKSFKNIIEKPLPPILRGVLRNYQKAGYDWLYFLKEYGFGGCLADDMGLGKTLQALALLLNEKRNGIKIPSLIVCPTSVVFNWEKEVDKFVSELKILTHAGLNRDRNALHFNDFDIIITSYGIMRRDIYFLKDFKFHYVILDESQKIKNPTSQTAKAVRLLSSQFRLVLTGTPVENNTIELWSQFAFLNPGLLGTLYYFKKAFTYSIEKKKEVETARFLRQIIYPFILRRTKEAVAQELPPKIEQTFYCAMNSEQERIYNHWRNYYRSMILNKIENLGMDKARINVLEGLVKLRQISCHPSLVDKNIFEDSGKFELLKEFIEEILAENHKILIFSQFVRMLKLIRKYLDSNKVNYEYLDGHTINRKEHVDRFQNDKTIKIFLISLKAGGVGLNLTAADYVIHYDPWWNPAVEVQATDRAHRIGQDKKVFVYRLITKNSVEEKMLELQARKKKLVSDLISTDSSFFKSLSKSDVEVLFS